jgi:hypothetical protein
VKEIIVHLGHVNFEEPVGCSAEIPTKVVKETALGF